MKGKESKNISKADKISLFARSLTGNAASCCGIKPYLRSVLLPDLKKNAPYFNIKAVRKMLKEKGIEAKDGTLRRYMSDTMAEGVVHDAGKGWYSRIETRCELDRKPVAKIVKILEKEFPLLEFACWSTQQINPWMHHILSKFLTFVNVEKEGMSAVSDVLREAGYTVHVNPGINRADEVLPNGKTVAIRPLVTRAPHDVHYSPPEGVLVDLFMENKILNIMGQSDYQDMAVKLASSSRISWGSLIYYAAQRKVLLRDMLGEDSTLLQK